MSHRRLVLFYLRALDLLLCSSRGRPCFGLSEFSLPHFLSCIPGPSPHTPSPQSQTRAYLPQYRARLRTALDRGIILDGDNINEGHL
ncbi:hypothetical protein B0H14DRAFT_2988653, partial [Mycena olivaceomarginata]